LINSNLTKDKMITRKCKRCGISRDIDVMYYAGNRKGYICNPTNYVHRAECSKRVREEED